MFAIGVGITVFGVYKRSKNAFEANTVNVGITSKTISLFFNASAYFSRFSGVSNSPNNLL